MEVALIDEFLRPGAVERLVRLGRRYDGGYLVDERCVAAADVLLSFGINDDWSFERDFGKLNAAPICAFDGTISGTKFLKEVVKSIPRIDDPRIFVQRVRTLVDYLRFFGRDARHVQALVGIERQPRFLSLSSIFSSYVPPHAANAFLKIDIEGWEYRILDDLAALSDRVCGMVIEFHAYDLHRDRIRQFIRSVDLNVCHVHCNNYEPLNEDATPLVIEVSLTKFDVRRGPELRLPHGLDMPNNRLDQDYRIEFR